MATSRGNVSARVAAIGALSPAPLLLGVLLLYLLLGQLIAPGFADYWGYQVAQVAATLVAIVIDDVRHGRDRVWSRETRGIVVVTTYVLSIGTTGHFFESVVHYDKISHFASGAAMAAACFEAVAYLRRHGMIADFGTSIALFAIGFSIFASILWEAYEHLGAAFLDSLRPQSWSDTYHDLVVDTLGAVLATWLVSRRR